jgi:alpha-glucosidase
MTDVCIKIDPDTNEYSRCEDILTAVFVREFCRTPFQWDDSTNAGFSTGPQTWLPLAQNYQKVNFKAQNGKKGSHVEIYKQLMKLKKTEAGVNGTLVIQALTDDVLLIKRELTDKKKESLLSIFNFGSQYIHLNFVNSSVLSEKLKVQLNRLNSFHVEG